MRAVWRRRATTAKSSPSASIRHRVQRIDGVEDGYIVRGNEPLVELRELKLVGRHNVANVLAALALCDAIGLAPASLLPALAAY